MALTRYSTAIQLDNNLEKITIKLTNIQKEERIDQADKYIKSKLSKLVDFTIIDAMATVPDWLNCLSQYKSAELSIAKIYGAKRDADQVSDLKYWADLFMELLKECQNGDIDFDAAAAGGTTFTWDSRRHVKPAFGPAETPKDSSGTQKYGEYTDLDELQEDRPYDETGDA